MSVSERKSENDVYIKLNFSRTHLKGMSLSHSLSCSINKPLPIIFIHLEQKIGQNLYTNRQPYTFTSLSYYAQSVKRGEHEHIQSLLTTHYSQDFFISYQWLRHRLVWIFFFLVKFASRILNQMEPMYRDCYPVHTLCVTSVLVN